MSNLERFEEIKKGVRDLIVKYAEVDVSEVRDDSLLVDDLGIDSMKAIELVAIIEKKYGLIISEDDIPNMLALKDIFNILEKLL